MFRRLPFWLLLLALILGVRSGEPSAHADADGIVHSTFSDLSTICEREKTLCKAGETIWHGITKAVGIGYSVAVGNGALVYVPKDAKTVSIRNNSLWNVLTGTTKTAKTRTVQIERSASGLNLEF